MGLQYNDNNCVAAGVDAEIQTMEKTKNNNKNEISKFSSKYRF